VQRRRSSPLGKILPGFLPAQSRRSDEQLSADCLALRELLDQRASILRQPRLYCELVSLTFSGGRKNRGAVRRRMREVLTKTNTREAS
jgi:hypothetical protein